MGVRMRINRSATGKRRSQYGLKEPRLSKCECGAHHKRHQVCHECGKYRGRQVVDVVARQERQQRRVKRKQEEAKEMGQPTSAQGEMGQEQRGAAEKEGKSEEKSGR